MTIRCVACHLRSTPPLTFDCDADNIDRFFTLRYVSDDVSVGTLFFIDIQGICTFLNDDMSICVEWAGDNFDLGLTKIDPRLTKICAKNDFYVFVPSDLDL